jgi:nucleoside phosphorylase
MISDVVIASDVWNYQKGKATAHGQQYTGSRVPLKNLGRIDWPTSVTLAFPGPKSNLSLYAPRLHRGLIAAGETVIKSAEERTRLLRREPDIIAVEMESAGALQALLQSKVAATFVVVKAIVDYCDEAKDDRWHQPGADLAASVLYTLINDGIV